MPAVSPTLRPVDVADGEEKINPPNSQTAECPLCKSKDTVELAHINKRIFLLCQECDLRFLRADLRLSPSLEKKRYDQHKNSMEDVGYLKFLSPLINAVVEKMPARSLGLDYGCGPEPVVSKLLEPKGYFLDLFDPFYCDTRENLESEYDFIICSEVFEHFFNPHKEIEFLKQKLKKGGSLFVMTQLWRNQLRFEDWYYHRDLTHVCFYSGASFRWIQQAWGFAKFDVVTDNLIIFS